MPVLRAASISRFICGLCVAMSMFSAARADDLVVDRDTAHVDLTSALTYYEDASGKLTIDEIASEDFLDKFRKPATDNINFGLTKSVYWVRVRLQRKADAPDHWILEIPFSHMRYIELYEPVSEVNGQTYFHVHYAGFSVPFDAREVKFRNSAFKLSFDRGALSKEFYFRFQNNGPMWFPMTLWQPHSFAESKTTEMYILGIYFGLIFAMLFYNAFLFGTLRDPAYLFYVLYVGSMSVLFASITGLGFEYLWPEHPNFAYVCPFIWTGCVGLCISLFTRTFLATKTSIPRMDKVIRFLSWYWGVTTLPLFLLQFYFGIGFFVYQLAAFLTMVCMLAAGFMALRSGFAPARFYVLSFFAVLLGGLAFILRNLGWLPANYITTYGLIAGSALEVILLSTALADRINILKREKEAAQVEVVKNKEYALQVLQEANRSLQLEIERRRETESRLYESREKYRVLFETLPLGVVVTDNRGRIIETNKTRLEAAEFDLRELGDAKSGLQLLTPSGLPVRKRDLPVVRALRSREIISNIEVGVARANARGQSGPIRWYSVTAAPMPIAKHGVILTYIDVTGRIDLELQRRQQQVELARASRFNTMGEMASALAHEINQPLGSALNYLHGIAQRLETNDVDAADIEVGVRQTIKQIDRAGNVIRHIHNFTRHHTPQVKTIDLNGLVQSIITFAEVDSRRFKVRLQTKMARSPLLVEVNEIEMGQVVLNLIKNGIDAMRDLPPEQRVLTIETQADAAHAKVSVQDRGPGIPADAREKIFEAFFTTKSDGLGLGLAVSRTIVHSHNGKIWVAADGPFARGTCVNFVLPMKGHA
jgi:C4-dicarboxylate-specific signal transduction histidine kinase